MVSGERSPVLSGRGSRRLHVSAALAAALALCAIPSSVARANVESIRAEASPTSINVGDTFVYRVVVTGSGTLPTPSNNIPSAFQILSGPNSNFSMEFVNGRMSSSRTLSYRLRAMRRGEHTIPAPIVKDGGRSISGNPVTVRVDVPAGAGEGQPDQQPSGEPDTRGASPGSGTIPRDELKPIFLRAQVNRDEVWLQQALVVRLTLYFQPSVNTFDVQKLPSTEGFWSEEWKVPNPPPVVERRVHGRLYNAAEIHRLVLFPTRTGELTIGPMDLVVQYRDSRRRTRRGFFDSIFDDMLEQTSVRSNPVTVHVKPLPGEGKPAGFENIVGDWRINSELDTDTARVNESVTLTATISGEGNVGFLPAPELEVPPDIELYEPEVQQNKRVVNGVVRGEKTFTWLLIPRRTGVQEIPPVEMSYFDPKRERYSTIRGEVPELAVLPAFGWAASERSREGAPAPVQSLSREIRWIMDTAPTLTRARRPLHMRAEYWGAYVLPALVVIAGAVVRRRRNRLAGQESLQRSRRAAKRAIAVLKDARVRLGEGDVGAGYDALARGIIGYLSDRLALPSASLDERTRARVLAEIGISQSSRDELHEILALCDTARFSPHGRDADTLQDLIERTQNWVISLDRALRPVGSATRPASGSLRKKVGAGA
ncbi:MAG: hypothetical protein MAG453_01361 [Calditrichaeota bacterium]|nr:hypothetical protein [Calditrichota bacterium]